MQVQRREKGLRNPAVASELQRYPANQLKNQDPSGTFSVKLEALRGLAALMVVGHHIFPTSKYPWMHVLFNGRAAVSLFFVLSGYVLGLSLRRGSGGIAQQYLFFMVRRVFRIYPAYFVTALLFVIYWKFYPFNGFVGPLAHLKQMRLTDLQVVKNFLFVDASVNPVSWSLKVEMAGSLMLPILYFLTRSWRWPRRLVVLIFLIGCGFAPGSGSTRQCLHMFYLGYLLIDLKTVIPKLSPGTYALITGACVLAFLNARFLGEAGLTGHVGLLLEAASAAGIIFVIQTGDGSLGGVLDQPWSHLIGQISFSLFLVHMLIQDMLLNLMMLSPLKTMTQHGLTFPFLGLALLVSTPIVVFTSWASYRWVESPFIKIGKSFGKRESLNFSPIRSPQLEAK